MTRLPSGPPQGPPGGHHPPSPPPPRPGRGGQVFAGVVLGGFGTIVLLLVSLDLIDQIGPGGLIVALVLMPVIGVSLWFDVSTRPWGIGILIGWAIVVIVLGGASVILLSSVD